MDDFELFVMALGYNLTSKELQACWTDMGVTDVMTLALFFDWWSSDVGPKMFKKGK